MPHPLPPDPPLDFDMALINELHDAANALGRLGELGITRELTGKARDRIYAYTEYLDILNEDTEPL